MSVHSAVVKIAFDEEQATIILQCETCGLHAKVELPLNHLATMANACAVAAQHAGVEAVTTPIATFATATASEAECDAVMGARLGRMH
jgi:pyruvate/oxaloacetate carboxyltransferase